MKEGVSGWDIKERIREGRQREERRGREEEGEKGER